MFLRFMFLLLLLVVSCKKNTTSTDIQPFPSPDIFYTSIRNGQTIVLSDIDGANPYPITSGEDEPAHPFFSSDGKYIIYSAFPVGAKSRSIYKFNLENIKKIHITDDSGNDSDPSISSDGSLLVFSSNRDNEQNAWNIYIMNMLSNKIKKITQGSHHYNPCFSPDDSKILFSEYSDGNNHLSIIDTTGANYVILESQEQFYPEFQFSSSNDKIYYVNDEGIASCRLDGSDKTLIVSDSSESITLRFFSPVDSLMYYCGHDYLNHIYRLYRLNIDNGTKTILKESNEKLSFGDCSSDGTKIIYQQFEDGLGNIVLLNLDNGIETQITDSEYHDHSPRFNKLSF